MLKACFSLIHDPTKADFHLVGEALIRYVNLGVTLGAVNLPEVNLRSLTLEEPDHARVSLFQQIGKDSGSLA